MAWLAAALAFSLAAAAFLAAAEPFLGRPLAPAVFAAAVSAAAARLRTGWHENTDGGATNEPCFCPGQSLRHFRFQFKATDDTYRRVFHYNCQCFFSFSATGDQYQKDVSNGLNSKTEDQVM